MTESFDVCIVGAGPAGSALARQLAQDGWHVALVAPDLVSGRSIGETVPGTLRGLLRELGLPGDLEAQGHQPGYARRSVWGDDELRERSCLFGFGGHGFHLDRPRFDAWLLASATASGTQLLRGTPRRLESNDGRISALWVSRGDSVERLTARFFIDASGRGAWLAKRMRAQREVIHDLVALAEWYELSTGDDVMLVHSAPHGWWYTASLPGAQRVVMWISEAKNAGLRDAPSGAGLLGKLTDAPRLQALLRAARPLNERTARRAGPTLCRWRPTSNWLPIGDAAAAFDPIAGEGLCFALRSALEAAGALRRAEAGDTSAFAAYGAGVTQVFQLHLRQRARTYGLEQRWPQSSFWSAAQRVTFSRSSREG